METRAWKVFMDGKKVDTVYFTSGHTAAEVKSSLIEHDGFAPDIVVKRGKKDSAHRRNRKGKNNA